MAWQRTLALALVPALVFTGLSGAAADVDMRQVRKLAAKPVQKIIANSPVKPIDDNTYGTVLQDRSKPVVVMFYANRGRNSRNLATLMRFLAQKYRKAINFYAYRVAANRDVPKKELDRLEQKYGVDEVPGTFFYDNDKGKLELERENYTVPTLKEYRTPSMFFWQTYFRSIGDYIDKNILD